MNPIKTHLREYLRAKGITPNEQGMIHCLWHEDNHPSCKVDDEYIYCFTCNESGDIYTAAAAMLDVPCDKEHFPAIARDVESTLGIVSDWKPARRKPGEPRTTVKLSESAMYRDLLLKDFATALDGGDLERAYYKATLLYALFLLPDVESHGAPQTDTPKPQETPNKAKRRTMSDKLASYGRVSA